MPRFLPFALSSLYIALVLCLMLLPGHLKSLPSEPPCALDNRHVDLCPGCGPCCGCSPSQPWLGAPGEHRLSPSPTDEEAFVEVQVSSKEVGVLEQQQKNAFGHIREGKRNSMTLSTSPPPQGGAPQCQVRLSRPVIAPVG